RHSVGSAVMSGFAPPGRPGDATASTSAVVAQRLMAALPVAGTGLLRDAARPDGPGPICPVLGWARTGAMWLTGWPDGPPQWPAGDVIGALEGVVSVIGELAGRIGGDA